MKGSKQKVQSAAPSPIYFFGGVGALVYYISVANGFGSIVVACLKAIVWPAFLTYDLLKFIT